MLNQLFQGIFDNTTTILIPQFLLCVGTALVIGIFFSLIYIFKSHYTKSFVIALALLPAAVCVVIMMVNGNVGTGVAVAGAFSLVRFRSAPGTAKEIGAIFIAMAAGLMLGIGYLGYALLFSFLLGHLSMKFCAKWQNFRVEKTAYDKADTRTMFLIVRPAAKTSLPSAVGKYL